MKFKSLLKTRIIIWLLVLILSVIWINPALNTDGVAIKSISDNSSAFNAGMRDLENVKPRGLEVITFINNNEIKNLEDYANELNKIKINSTFRIDTDKGRYTLLRDFNDIGVSVTEVAGTNLGKGLDLAGGTRVILKPEIELTDEEFEILLATMKNRLDFYGVKDIKVKDSKDLLGSRFVVVEVAGASKEEVKDLVASQGKFEAKIGNDTVFEGGLGQDIASVCRNDGTCSGIRLCQPGSVGYNCQFEFAIKLTQKAAERHAEVTDKLEINTSTIATQGQGVLSKTLDLYLDGKLFDSLTIGASLKGQKATDISISGPGVGLTQEEAFNDANKAMNRLQTLLETGSLPTALEIVELKSISPVLGKVFVDNAIKVGFYALLAVSILIFIRYRKLRISIPMVIVSATEIIIVLGIAAVVGFRMDLAAIAGIIASVGTGFDDLIVITDEAIRDKEQTYNWKERFKRAFFIIFVAWLALVAAMIPLFWAGAGLVTGFAFTTILGVSVGVFITRPAYSNIIEALFKE